MVTDPIGDLLVRIKNGGNVRKTEVLVPYSRVKEAVLKVILEAGYITGYDLEEKGFRKSLVVRLKYDSASKHVIKGVKRLSFPGCHLYVSRTGMRKYLRSRNKLGIISTSRGIISHRQALRENLGGEFMALLW